MLALTHRCARPCYNWNDFVASWYLIPAPVCARWRCSMPISGQSIPPLLVGRDREQRVLRDRLAGVVAGHGSLILIGGEAGIGKTTLAASLAADAENVGALVL